MSLRNAGTTSCLLLLAVMLAVLAACSDEVKERLGLGGANPPTPLRVQNKWQDVRNLAGHEAHVAQRGIACESCHSMDGEDFDKPSPERCRVCHETHTQLSHAAEQARVRFGEGIHADCTHCHAFTRDDAEAPLASPWGCQRCHEAHFATSSAMGPPGHPPSSSPAPSPPRHPQLPSETSSQTEHAPPGVPSPPAYGIPSRAAPTKLVHASVPCQNCHSPHGDPSVLPAACGTCHADLNLEHGQAHGGSEATACRSCHTKMHAPAQAVEPCESCHASESPVVNPQRALFAGHASCTSCHTPHAFGAKQAQSCASCHAQTRTLAADKVAAHADCRSCHQPHDVRNAARSCQQCHGETGAARSKRAGKTVYSDHPPVPGASSECTTCHAPHPRHGAGPKPHPTLSGGVHPQSAAPCSSCHREAKTELGFHGDSIPCTRCHRPHTFKLSLKQLHLCQECHAQQLTAARGGAGHRTCKNCHGGLPHDLTQPTPPCGACHAEAAREVRHGHQNCQSCHDAHSTTVVTACGSCHAEAHRTAPAGHQNCVSCHSPHSGARRPEVSCQSCHAQQSQALHHDVPGGCTSCHRAHGPGGVAAPPGCTTCHSESKLPSLHQTPQHQQCSQCHQGHDKSPFPQKPVCLSCHTDQQQHFPNAARCTNCHAFKRL